MFPVRGSPPPVDFLLVVDGPLSDRQTQDGGNAAVATWAVEDKSYRWRRDALARCLIATLVSEKDRCWLVYEAEMAVVLITRRFMDKHQRTEEAVLRGFDAVVQSLNGESNPDRYCWSGDGIFICRGFETTGECASFMLKTMLEEAAVEMRIVVMHDAVDRCEICRYDIFAPMYAVSLLRVCATSGCSLCMIHPLGPVQKLLDTVRWW
jgi:hypothetical protein